MSNEYKQEDREDQRWEETRQLRIKEEADLREQINELRSEREQNQYNLEQARLKIRQQQYQNEFELKKLEATIEFELAALELNNTKILELEDKRKELIATIQYYETIKMHGYGTNNKGILGNNKGILGNNTNLLLILILVVGVIIAAMVLIK